MTTTNRYHPDAPEWMIAAAREYIAATTWTFAKTMADVPHWYAVRQRAQAAGLGPGHERLYLLIKQFNYRRHWRGRTYRSIDLDGYVYWIIVDGTVINRTPVTEPTLI